MSRRDELMFRGAHEDVAHIDELAPGVLGPEYRMSVFYQPPRSNLVHPWDWTTEDNREE